MSQYYKKMKKVILLSIVILSFTFSCKSAKELSKTGETGTRVVVKDGKKSPFIIVIYN